MAAASGQITYTRAFNVKVLVYHIKINPQWDDV